MTQALQPGASPLRIAILCATNRGFRALKCLRALAPEAEFLVVTYLETPHEPPFVNAIREFSERNGCRFLVQTDVSKPPAVEYLSEAFDLLFCFSWRYMVPPEIYRSTRLGAYVVHDSLLPKYRGFSPMVWALMNGEKEVGVTLFEMAEEVDSGRIVGQKAVPVTDSDDIGTLREKGTVATLAILREHFPHLATGKVTLTEQDESEATYCCKWTPEDAKIYWSRERKAILNLIRATTKPYPGAFCIRGDDRLTIWKAERPINERTYASRQPGAITSINSDGTVGVLTGDGEIILRKISVNSGPAMLAADYFKSHSVRLE